MNSPLRTLALPFFRGRFSGVGSRLSVPRPDDSPSAHSPGIEPDRVLTFGNGAAVGWGVRSHDLALPGQLARQLSALTGRGVDADLVADPAITIQNALEYLPVDRVVTYDAVVVIIGFGDALRMTSARHWKRDMAALLDRLIELRSAGAEIVVQAIHRPSSIRYFSFHEAGPLDEHTEILNAITRELCEELPGVRFLAVRPHAAAGRESDGHLPAAELFRMLAAAIATPLAPLLDDHFSRGREACPLRVRPQSDDDRMAAIRGLGILDTPHEKRFDESVERARVLLGASRAAFSLIDGGRVWNKAVSGVGAATSTVDAALCTAVLGADGAFVVPDVWEDARFEASDDVRFFAGYPIQTTRGIRIGALCVTDSEPRQVESVDLVLLRELALTIQRELAERPVGLTA